MSRTRLISLSLLFAMSACAAKVNIAPAFKAPSSAVVAILPSVIDEEISRENVLYLNQRLRAELEQRNWFVISEDALSRFCEPSSCNDLDSLANAYQVKYFFRLSVDDFSSNDFLIAHYNTISGKLEVLNTTDDLLFSSELKLSDRGGLLLESGQILKGLKELVKNNDTRFPSLAERFIEKLVDPTPNLQIEDSILSKLSTAPELSDVSYRKMALDKIEICANGTPENFASVLLTSTRAGLRETKAGTYCAIFNIGAVLKSQKSKLLVELRSAFGSRSTKALNLEQFEVCSLKDRVFLDKTPQGTVLSIQCPESNQAVAMSPIEVCPDIEKHCPNATFEIFRATNRSQAFQRIGKTKSPVWIDSQVSPEQSFTYRVLAISKSGRSSLAEPALSRIEEVK